MVQTLGMHVHIVQLHKFQFSILTVFRSYQIIIIIKFTNEQGCAIYFYFTFCLKLHYLKQIK